MGEKAGQGSCCVMGSYFLAAAVCPRLFFDIIFTLADIDDGGLIGGVIAGLLTAYLGFTARKKYVQLYNIEGWDAGGGESWEGDGKEFCCWFWCQCCSLQQEHRTLNAIQRAPYAPPAPMAVPAPTPQPALMAQSPPDYPAGPTLGDGLPPGWTATSDASTGNTYYYHTD